MHCAYCGVEYGPGESCLCVARNSATSDNRNTSENHSVLEYPGETDAFCSLSLDPSRGGIP